MSELRENPELGPDAAAGFSFEVVVASFNGDITGALRDGALQTLERHGARADAVRVHTVPGAFELPMAAARLVDGRPDAIICLGALIKGETPHFEHLCSSVAHAILETAVRSRIPVIFGVLTCELRAHAEARAGGAKGNKGAEAATAAIEMATLFATISSEGAANGYSPPSS